MTVTRTENGANLVIQIGATVSSMVKGNYGKGKEHILLQRMWYGDRKMAGPVSRLRRVEHIG